MSDQRQGYYFASKTKHAAKWRELRARGVPVVSTWIDEAGQGETKSFEDLWRRCISEASSARVVILYVERDEVLKGAFIEAGAALASGVPVIVCGYPPDGWSWLDHHLVSVVMTVEHALKVADGRCGWKTWCVLEDGHGLDCEPPSEPRQSGDHLPSTEQGDGGGER